MKGLYMRDSSSGDTSEIYDNLFRLNAARCIASPQPPPPPPPAILSAFRSQNAWYALFPRFRSGRDWRLGRGQVEPPLEIHAQRVQS
eukprot:1098040-Pleurochrysis_carterae.AAC.1